MGAPTASQRAAIECDEHLILFAGPGSGKTSTSIKKARRILTSPKRRLILCTFTVQAAAVLRSRLEQAFAQDQMRLPADRVHVGTLDSLALRHLQWHLRREGLRDLKLLAPNAQAPMLRQITRELGLGKYEELAPFLERYQSALEREAVLEQLKADQPAAVELITAYIDRLKAGGLVDLATVKRTCALNMSKGIIPPFQVGDGQATDFVIDEVQDSDELQLLMARTMADAGAITTLVGDDDQTIYAWRSACGYRGMTQFIEHTKAQVVRLGENFRSRAEIVEAATNLIAFNNPDRVDKQQRSMRGVGGSVACVSFSELKYEIAWVCRDILLRRLDDVVPPSCAILARRNMVLNALESKLRGYGIDYARSGPSLWEREEIVNYLQLLRFTASGEPEGLAILLSALNFYGATINQAMDVVASNGVTFGPQLIEKIDTRSPEERRLLTQIFTAVAMWRKHLAANWISRVIDDSADSLVRWLRGGPAPADDEPETAKVARSKEMIGYAHEALLLRSGKLSTRLRDLLKPRPSQLREGAVQLMTMHGSKGLEFDSVYLVDCAEKDDDTTLTSAQDERRVLYVAMTRAERYLRITFSGKLPVFLKEARVEQISPAQPDLPSEVTAELELD